MREEWHGFKGSHWQYDINVRDFIQNNYTPYDGDEAFLAGPTEATDKLWGRVQELQAAERANGGVLDCETEVVSGLTAYGPGYIDADHPELERVVGLQTDKPLKRAFMPYGGIKMAQQAAETYGFHVDDKYDQIFNEYHKTHNTRPRCAPPATATSSPVCPTPTAAAASWATTVAWPSMASTS